MRSSGIRNKPKENERTRGVGREDGLTLAATDANNRSRPNRMNTVEEPKETERARNGRGEEWRTPKRLHVEVASRTKENGISPAH